MLTAYVQVRDVRVPLQAVMVVMVMVAVSAVMCAARRLVRADRLQLDAPEQRQRAGSPSNKACMSVACCVYKTVQTRE